MATKFRRIGAFGPSKPVWILRDMMKEDKHLDAMETFVLSDDRDTALRSEFAPNSQASLFFTGKSALHLLLLVPTFASVERGAN